MNLAWLAVSVFLAAAPPAAPACETDRAALLALPFPAFDEQMGQGWRVVGDRAGCEAEAADLIAEYRAAHAVQLVEGPPEAIRSLDWHEGQLRAAAGQTARAVALMRRGSRERDEAGDSRYHRATIAFLRHDRGEVERLRAELLALPKPSWFDAAVRQTTLQPGMTPPAWPPHLAEVDGLLNCFDRPYAEAYTVRCRVTPPR